MQEFEYRLEKEDYKNWIHWNVLKHESKKMKMVSDTSNKAPVGI